MATDASLRILRLRALIDHPRTGIAERDAAQRILDRILAKGASVRTGDRSYGMRHNRPGRHADLDVIAEMIRDDITVTRAPVPEFAGPGELSGHDPIRDAPAAITFEVTSPHDGSVVVTLGNVPRTWGWDDTDGIEAASPSMRELAAALADLMNSYNRNGTDIGRRFFATVRVDGGETLAW
ncbi:hypothetical protein [Nocardia macrotermitis]|uniref:Uncharacterized protein n=1 Tax=Nocardia macrotermitis TaxID=2585198 RepID=A0A7K0CVY1_9NOCA|nr:hypothetical protein [Nocardia macrotermitis]MQY17667.1 hypothetical protein [Nocardia macrotermitis]